MGFQMNSAGLSRAMYDMEKRVQERSLIYAQAAARQLEVPES